jgi:hypothetical protein
MHRLLGLAVFVSDQAGLRNIKGHLTTAPTRLEVQLVGIEVVTSRKFKAGLNQRLLAAPLQGDCDSERGFILLRPADERCQNQPAQHQRALPLAAHRRPGIQHQIHKQAIGTGTGPWTIARPNSRVGPINTQLQPHPPPPTPRPPDAASRENHICSAICLPTGSRSGSMMESAKAPRSQGFT